MWSAVLAIVSVFGAAVPALLLDDSWERLALLCRTDVCLAAFDQLIGTVERVGTLVNAGLDSLLSADGPLRAQP